MSKDDKKSKKDPFLTVKTGHDKTDIIVNSFVETHKVEKEKRNYRKREEFPDPDAPRWAEANRTSEKFNSRVSAYHADLFNRLSELFPTKRAALEALIEQGAKEAGLNPDDP